MKVLYGKTLANEWIDWVENSNGTREEEIFPVLKEWIRKTRPKIIADIGCGQGICSRFVSSKMQYIGIDPSSALLRHAKKLYTEQNKKFAKGTAYNTHLKDSSVDAIMSIWVWSHLDNLDAAAKEMYRVLKPKGKYIIITANPETYDERKTFYSKYQISGNLLRGDFNLGNGKSLTNTTLYLHTKEQIAESIKDVKLTIASTSRLGKAATGKKGLYLVIEGSKS
jgi:ubiquinone/menaquinone biosynthesis C-methylase UbiE